jgi:cell division protein FtsB
MREFQQQRRMRAFFASRTVLIVLLLLLVGAGITSFRVLLDGMRVAAERSDVEEKLQELEAKREALTSELEDLRTGQGIEREAREKLNYKKQGEEVVIILDETNPVISEDGSARTSLWSVFKQRFLWIISNAH